MAVEALAQFQPETAVYLRDLYSLGILNIAWIGWLWKKLKEERSEADGIPIEDLEVHHKKRRWEGGTDDENNLTALKKTEHALEHYKAAQKAKGKARRNEYGAVHLIVQRMSPEELAEFNKHLRD